MQTKPEAYFIRPAREADSPSIASCVSAAYAHYIPRIGKPPAPMLEDYAEVIRSRQVSVIEKRGRIIGVVVFAQTDEGFLLENVAVEPEFQGQGAGRQLLEYAEEEARRQGFGAVHLSTNVHMTENQALYRKIGYREYDRREEKGYSRVYMRKPLSGHSADRC